MAIRGFAGDVTDARRDLGDAQVVTAVDHGAAGTAVSGFRPAAGRADVLARLVRMLTGQHGTVTEIGFRGTNQRARRGAGAVTATPGLGYSQAVLGMWSPGVLVRTRGRDPRCGSADLRDRRSTTRREAVSCARMPARDGCGWRRPGRCPLRSGWVDEVRGTANQNPFRSGPMGAKGECVHMAMRG